MVMYSPSVSLPIGLGRNSLIDIEADFHTLPVAVGLRLLRKAKATLRPAVQCQDACKPIQLRCGLMVCARVTR